MVSLTSLVFHPTLLLLLSILYFIHSKRNYYASSNTWPWVDYYFWLDYFPLPVCCLLRECLLRPVWSSMSLWRVSLIFSLVHHGITYLCYCCFLCTLHFGGLKHCYLVKSLFLIRWTFLRTGLISYFYVYITFLVGDFSSWPLPAV